MTAIVPPDPPLSDGVVTLRLFTLDDIPDVVRGCRDPDVVRWTAWIPPNYTERDAREFIEGQAQSRAEGTDVTFAMVDAGGGELLGGVGLHGVDREEGSAQIGYWVGIWARNRGVATRAAVLLSTWALRELELGRLELMTFPGNTASERVAEKAGFVREGLLRQYTLTREGRRDATMWSLLPADLG
jgi:RimJ/RimL family protein N-acetyltransferase